MQHGSKQKAGVIRMKSYLSTGCTERAVGRHGDGVQVARVADVVRLQLAVGEIPDLHTQIRECNGL